MNNADLWHYEFIGEICVNAVAALTYAFLGYWTFLLYLRFQDKGRAGFRFLLPLAIAVAIDTLFRLGGMILPGEHFVRDLVAYVRSGGAPKFAEPANPGDLTGVYKQISDYWEGVDLMFSFVGNYLLFVAGAAVNSMRVSRKVWSGTGLAALAGFALDHRDAIFHLPQSVLGIWIVDGLDTAIGMAALAWVGWNLAYRLAPRLDIGNEVLRTLLPRGTFCIYLLLAGVQPLYYLHKVFGVQKMPTYYGLLLLALGISKSLAVFAFCSFPDARLQAANHGGGHQ
jgi:hypothetical protein